MVSDGKIELGEAKVQDESVKGQFLPTNKVENLPNDDQSQQDQGHQHFAPQISNVLILSTIETPQTSGTGLDIDPQNWMISPERNQASLYKTFQELLEVPVCITKDSRASTSLHYRPNT